MNEQMDAAAIASVANELRRTVVEMVYRAGSGHLGGSLSAAEIVATLYFSRMRIDPVHPQWEGRDRLVLSKGHAAPVVYAALARLGYFSEERLWTLRQVGSILQGHPDMLKTPGIDMTTGSLGQGLSVGVGMALAGRMTGASYRVYVLLGDGELNEGQVWEAAMSAAKFRVANLTAICDLNGLQLDGPTQEVMPISDVSGVWESLGWSVVQADGHSVTQLYRAFDQAVVNKTGPTVILAKTTKGKGISFMEDDYRWHGRQMSPEDYRAAIAELDNCIHV